MAIRLLIVEAHEMVRSGLARMVEGTDIEVVGQASDLAEAVACATHHQPDVVLIDSRLHNIDGRTVLSAMRRCRPEAAVVVLTTYDAPNAARRFRAMGASGAYLKGADRAELLSSLRAAANDRKVAAVEAVRWPGAPPELL